MVKLSISLIFSSMLCLTGILPAWSSQQIVIQGKVKNAVGKKVIFCKTINGIYTQWMDTLQVQPDSTFTITISSESPERIDFIHWKTCRLGSVYLRPGITKMDIVLGSDTPLIMDSTPENKVMKRLGELDDAVWKLRACKSDLWDIARDTVATSVYNKLKAYAMSVEKELGDMDKTFKRKAIQDIRMQLLLTFESRYFSIYDSAAKSTKMEWDSVFFKMLEFVNLNHPDNVFSPAFSEAINKQFWIKAYTMTGDNSPRDMNKLNQAYFNGFEKELKGKVQEAAMAHLILGNYLDEEYSTGIPDLYDRFVALYPQSVLLPLLRKTVEVNESFNQVSLSASIRFINSDSIQTFKQLTQRFPGKVIFVDIWATWCGPCRQSFAFVKPLQQYAKEQGIVLLYISIDQPRNKDKWEKMANYYDLKGEHIIVNESLDGDLRKIFGKNGTLYIPHCAIVNIKGDLQFPKAVSPENMDKLMIQLKEAAL